MPARSRRRQLKSLLAARPSARPAAGTSVLIYHRVGGGSPDELDLATADFRAQADALAALPDGIVVGLDEAVRRLRAGDRRPTVVLTFDDGFADVHANAWPVLRERQLPFTIYLATAHLDGVMTWEGSTARETGAPALRWSQLAEMHGSGLLTVGNHTHTHVRPERLSVGDIDACSDVIEQRLGVRPRHFAYPWGIPVPALADALASRFDSVATGTLGRNTGARDLAALRRIPVRSSDPLRFFRAKLTGRLLPERAYARVVSTAKAAGARA